MFESFLHEIQIRQEMKERDKVVDRYLMLQGLSASKQTGLFCILMAALGKMMVGIGCALYHASGSTELLSVNLKGNHCDC